MHSADCGCLICKLYHKDFTDKIEAERREMWANFHADRAHGELPAHGDLTQPIPEIGGADQVRVDLLGKVLDGTTHVGKKKINW